MDFYGSKCFLRMEVSRDDDFTNLSEHCGASPIMNIVGSFGSFGSEELLSKFIQAFMDQSRLRRSQNSLTRVLQSEAIWKYLAGAVMDRNGLQSLVEEGVRALVHKRQPVFSWHMPHAKLKAYPYNFPPTIEAFPK